MSLSNKITIELYRVDVLNNRFVKIDEVSTHRNLYWFDRLNGVGGVTFDLDIKDPKADITNWKQFVTAIAINVNGQIRWVGCAAKTTGTYYGVSGRMNIEGFSYLYHLMGRYLTLKYKDLDAAAEAWEFIDEVQSRVNGELMIREGTIETVGNTSDTLQNQKVAQAIINQSDNLVGYDFELVPVTDSNGLLSQVNFNAYVLKGVTRDRYAPLEFGVNVSGATYTLANEVSNNVTGQGAGVTNEVITRSASDGTSQVEFTRRESIQPFKGVSSYNTLAYYTQAFLDKNKSERYMVNVTLKQGGDYKFGGFQIGDFLKLNLIFPNGLTMDGTARVIELGHRVDINGVITLEPKLEVIL